MNSAPLQKILLTALFLFIAASFITLPRNPLLNDDASLYALAAKNTVQSGQWLASFITPGDPHSFLDKPPLGVWMIAWLPKIAGISELTVHIPNVLNYTLILAIFYFWLLQVTGKKIALYSTLAAATSLGLIIFSRAPKMDIPLALFVLCAHIFLFNYLKWGKPLSLYLFSISVALAFLTKSGFGILFPGLTALSIFLISKQARQKLLSLHLIPCAIIFILICGSVLLAQSLVLKEQWPLYLRSILIQSKYNAGYLGFSFNPSVIGFLFIIAFPWTAFVLSGLKVRLRRESFNLKAFCNVWIWSNLLFLFFFFKLSDLRTFVPFVPPMALLAGARIAQLRPAAKKNFPMLAWNLLFLFILSAAFIALIANPYNGDKIYLGPAIPPLFLLTAALALITFYLWKPSPGKFAASFIVVCLAYSALFYFSLPLARAFNPETSWPGMIKEYRQAGYEFIIYRPLDRNLFFSPDLTFVDFHAGPADKYCWEPEELREYLSRKVIILSDTKSWEKLNIKGGKLIAQDNYSSLILK